MKVGTELKFFRIAFVGAPSSGKSSVLAMLGKNILNADYAADIIPEAATELLSQKENAELREKNGAEFQKKVAAIQLSSEETLLQKAVENGKTKYIQLTDRALPDMFVYLSKRQISSICEPAPKLSELLQRYDAVLFFDLYRNGEEIKAGNELRMEKNAEQLEELHRISLSVYSQHSHFVRIPCFDTVEEKAEYVRDALNSIVGEAVF